VASYLSPQIQYSSTFSIPHLANNTPHFDSHTIGAQSHFQISARHSQELSTLHLTTHISHTANLPITQLSSISDPNLKYHVLQSLPILQLRLSLPRDHLHQVLASDRAAAPKLCKSQETRIQLLEPKTPEKRGQEGVLRNLSKGTRDGEGRA